MRRASPAVPSPAGTATLLRPATAGSVLIVLLAGGAALAQGLEGSLLSATISERVEVDDNYNLDDPSPGTSYYADTRLGLGFLNETDTQSFALGLDTGLRALWRAEENFEFTLASPTTASLDYVHEWADGLFDAALEYRQRRVDFTQSLEDFIDAGGNIDDLDNLEDLDQLQGNSRQIRYDANIGVAFGTSGRSSYELRFLGTQVDYTEQNPSQVARTTAEGQGTWTLQLTPVLSSAVFADYLYYQADNAAQTELRVGELDAGVIYEPSESVELGLGLGYADRKREDNGVQTESNTGPALRANARYTGDNFVLNANARVSTAAPTTRFSGDVRAVYTLPRGRVTGRLFQNYTGTSSGGTEARVTGAGIGIIRNLNNVSRLGLDFAVANQVDVDEQNAAPEPDINRVTATATYSYDLTAVVSADVGYRFRSREQNPDSAASNAVFVQIGRTFETRP